MDAQKSTFSSARRSSTNESMRALHGLVDPVRGSTTGPSLVRTTAEPASGSDGAARPPIDKMLFVAECPLIRVDGARATSEHLVVPVRLVARVEAEGGEVWTIGIGQPVEERLAVAPGELVDDAGCTGAARRGAGATPDTDRPCSRPPTVHRRMLPQVEQLTHAVPVEQGHVRRHVIERRTRRRPAAARR